MKILLGLFFVLSFMATGFGQIPKLTNKDVIEMVATGLPESVIISKIKISETAFDTDITSLKTLNDGKVSAAIISVMIEKSAEKSIESTWDAPEYGNLSEIKDATKVFVNSEDLTAREIMVKVLANYPRLIIVGTAKEADFLLGYRNSSKDIGISVIGSSVTKNNEIVGELLAYKRGSVDELNKRHQRIIWSTRKKQSFSSGITLNRHPAFNAINEFIKELKKLRGEK